MIPNCTVILHIVKYPGAISLELSASLRLGLPCTRRLCGERILLWTCPLWAQAGAEPEGGPGTQGSRGAAVPWDTPRTAGPALPLAPAGPALRPRAPLPCCPSLRAPLACCPSLRAPLPACPSLRAPLSLPQGTPAPPSGHPCPAAPHSGHPCPAALPSGHPCSPSGLPSPSPCPPFPQGPPARLPAPLSRRPCRLFGAAGCSPQTALINDSSADNQ